MKRMIRGIIDSVVEGAIKRVAMSGRPGESFKSREYFQHYGFTSRPLAGAEGILIREGNHFVLVASDDRRYRIAIEGGEVAFYTDEGDFIHFKRGMEIHVNTGNRLVVDAAAQVEVNTPIAVVNAAARCQVNSPEINLGGDRGMLRRLIDERFAALFNDHEHSGVQNGVGNTDGPTTTLELGSHATEVTRAL